MKHLQSIVIILASLYAGVILKQLIPLPIPETVYGMLVLFILLKTGCVKLDTVSEVADFLLAYLAIFFLPPATGLIESYSQISSKLIPIMFIVIVSTVLTMLVTGLTVNLVRRRTDVQ